MTSLAPKHSVLWLGKPAEAEETVPDTVPIAPPQ